MEPDVSLGLMEPPLGCHCSGLVVILDCCLRDNTRLLEMRGAESCDRKVQPPGAENHRGRLLSPLLLHSLNASLGSAWAAHRYRAARNAHALAILA